MIDTVLAYNLLKAVPPSCQLGKMRRHQTNAATLRLHRNWEMW
jgi:hypothetical protein